MCTLIKRILCISVIGVIAFLVIALWSGGEKFRWFGEKTGGAIRKSSEELGEKADAIKETKDTATEKIKKWTGTKDDEPEETGEVAAKKSGKRDTAKHPAKSSSQKKEVKSDSPKGDESEEKSWWQSAREWWSKMMHKLKGPERDQ
ncbi:MAG: hypothetical protein AB1553_10650 [Nitrospirota bacterium]